MLEALSVLVFWRRERRKEHLPVDTERRRMSTKQAQKHLMQSVERLNAVVEKKCEKLR